MKSEKRKVKSGQRGREILTQRRREKIATKNTKGAKEERKRGKENEKKDLETVLTQRRRGAEGEKRKERKKGMGRGGF